MLAHGCYRLQGFGIACPMERDALIEMIETGAPIIIPPAPVDENVPHVAAQ